MKILDIKKQKETTTYEVEVNSKTWVESQKKAFNFLASNLNISGFRKGHVPEALAKTKISQGEIFERASRKIVNETYEELVKTFKENENEFIQDALTVDYAKIDEKTLVIKYIFENQPKVKICSLKELKIDAYHQPVNDTLVDLEIDRLIAKDIVVKEKANQTIAKGDRVVFDFEGFIDDKAFPGGQAKNYELEIGSNSFIPGFEEQMIGLKVNDQKDIKVVFPKDYHAKEFANKEAVFKLKINQVKEIQKPTINGEYLTKLNIPGINDEKGLRKFVKESMESYFEQEYKKQANEQISRQIAEKSTINFIPPSVLNMQIKMLRERTEQDGKKVNKPFNKYVLEDLKYPNMEEYEKNLKIQAEKNLILTFAIDQLIQDFKVAVSEKDIEQYLENTAKKYHMPVAKLKELYGNDLSQIHSYLLQSKVFDQLITIVKENKEDKKTTTKAKTTTKEKATKKVSKEKEEK